MQISLQEGKLASSWSPAAEPFSSREARVGQQCLGSRYTPPKLSSRLLSDGHLTGWCWCQH